MLKQVLDAVRTKLDGVEAWFVPGVTMLDLKRSCQLDRFSCGAQCVSMILSVFGKAKAIGRIVGVLDIGEKGVGPTRIREFLERHGLKVRRKNRATLEDIKRAIAKGGSPVLLCSKDGGHWIVAFGFTKNAVCVADPSICVRSLRTRWPDEKFEAYRDRTAYIVSKE
jgi:ABC-type bacteriocin/lantibiotic exporter with double-glycine peptidase domain